MFCIHSPPVSRSTAKLHENQQPLWCCFGRSWKRKIKRCLGFFIYFFQRLTVGGNGRITVACWCIVTTANKNLAVNCGEVASQTYGILQYKNLLMAQYRCLRCSNLFMSFSCFLLNWSKTCQWENICRSDGRTFIEAQTDFSLFICTCLSSVNPS